MDYFNVCLQDEYIKQLPSLSLAYIGDAVFELMVRTKLAAEEREAVRKMHSLAIKLVAAPAQAKFIKKIIPMLNDDEKEIYRRGRNAKVNSIPNASTTMEYHEATALEVLFGYLYLGGKKDRLNDIFNAMMEEDHVS